MPMIISALQWFRNSRLARRDHPLTTIWQIIGWWEARRPLFNAIVGITGTVSCIIVLIIALVGDFVFGIPLGLPDPPIFAILAIIFYGIIANVCYTGGWVVEVLVSKAWPAESESFATLAFTLGLVFAVLLTILPGVLFVPLAGTVFIGAMAGWHTLSP